MSFKKTFKKVARVGVSAAAGFAGGGGVGALGATTKAVVDNSKTGEAKTLNLKTVGTDAAVGFGTAAASAALFAGAKVVLSKTAAPVAGATGKSTLGKVGEFGKKGGLFGTLKNQATGFIKSGGLANVAGQFAKGKDKVKDALSGFDTNGLPPELRDKVQAIKERAGSVPDNEAEPMPSGYGPGGEGKGSPASFLPLVLAALLAYALLRRGGRLGHA